jgi:hypothetical protein
MLMCNVRFRWAVCQLDALERCLNPPSLRKALDSLPKTLDETYERILCNIDEEEYGEYALKILQWLACSERPLQLEEVAELVTIDIKKSPQFDPGRRFPDPRDILLICSSLVTWTTELSDNPHGKDTRGQIRLAHFSVKEYLVSERIQDSNAKRYSIRGIDTNAAMADVCLAYLLYLDNPECFAIRRGKEFPLAGYAAKYWIQHARKAESGGSVPSLIMDFLLSKRPYERWVRLFDPDTSQWGELTEIVPSPLYYASRAGLIETTRLLIEAGAVVNAQGGQYVTALQAASIEGHYQVVQLLLTNGADINLRGGYCGNALQAASITGNDQVIQTLLENGADVNV